MAWLRALASSSIVVTVARNSARSAAGEGAGESVCEPCGGGAAQGFAPAVSAFLLLPPDVADFVASAGSDYGAGRYVPVDDALKLLGMVFLKVEGGGDGG